MQKLLFKSFLNKTFDKNIRLNYDICGFMFDAIIPYGDIYLYYEKTSEDDNKIKKALEYVDKLHKLGYQMFSKSMGTPFNHFLKNVKVIKIVECKEFLVMREILLHLENTSCNIKTALTYDCLENIDMFDSLNTYPKHLVRKELNCYDFTKEDVEMLISEIYTGRISDLCLKFTQS